MQKLLQEPDVYKIVRVCKGKFTYYPMGIPQEVYIVKII
jgi:hypothetical protein